MQVAFISECSTFYKIIASSLAEKYPQLSFVHYDHPDAFINSNQLNFSHFIFKLTNRDNFDLKIKTIKKRFATSITIGLVLNREFKTLKSIESSFDFFFNDSEIEEKLNIYFGQQISNSSQINTSSKLVIEQNKKKYIQLDTKMSRCLVLISENKTSKEIAQALSKSDRTIEKYTTFLRNYFNVKKKSDLAKVVYEIANN